MPEESTELRIPNPILEQFPGEILRTEPIAGFGHSADVHAAWTTAGSFVVRCRRGNDAAWKYEKEAWCMEQADAVGVPAARPVAWGKAGDWDYLVQSKIDGVNGMAWQGDAGSLWQTLGRYARAINSINTRGYGPRLANPDQSQFSATWMVHVEDNLRPLYSETFLTALGLLTHSGLARVWKRLDELFTWDFQPTLTHGQLHLRNTVVTPEGRLYIVDWETARAHLNPHLEVTSTLLWAEEGQAAEFLEGYGFGKRDQDRYRRDLDTLMLLCVLSTMRWLWERDPDGWTNAPPFGLLSRKLDRLLRIL